jgi:hypothetical protein
MVRMVLWNCTKCLRTTLIPLIFSTFPKILAFSVNRNDLHILIALFFLLTYAYLAFVIKWLLNLRFFPITVAIFPFHHPIWALKPRMQPQWNLVCIILPVVHLCRCWHIMVIFFMQTERSVDMLLHGKKPLVEVTFYKPCIEFFFYRWRIHGYFWWYK